ncbi:MAG: putative Zn-dependent protease, minimal metalloprotease (MMP)-like domain [Dehalococcoidia bacterium]|nr:putative Zn-dependent protease, minimal metalloprotease (MMP)-like domain [Dehalococcoidia bacterium]
MTREKFEELARRAVESLPEEFKLRLENVDILVEDRPTVEQRGRRGSEILGLYEGVPHTERGENYNLAMPDRITLFQKPIEAMCRSDEEIATEIERTIIHEVAHHFGIDDRQLKKMGW